MFDFTLPHVNILVAAGVVSIVLGLIFTRNLRIIGSGFLTLSFLAIAWWTLAAAIESSSGDQATKILWAKIQYIAMVNIMPLLVLFVLSYTGRIRKPFSAWLSIFWLVPLLGLALVWTNEWHGLIWSGYQAIEPATKLMVYDHGLGYWVMAVYFYVLVLLMLMLLVIEIVRSPHRKFRWQNLLMILATLAPAAGGVIYLSGRNPIPGLDLTVVATLISVILMTASVFGFHFMDIVPVASAFLLEQMEAGVLVIDPSQRLVEMNPALKRLFPNKKIQIGMDAKKLLISIGVNDVSLDLNGKPLQQEIIGNNEVWYCLDFKLNELYRKNQFLGWLGEFRDISVQKQAGQEKERINAQLKEKLLEVEKLQTELREQAIRDPLTNVYNRRFFDETFSRELAMAKRTQGNLCLIMVDIDHFKEINDQFGHNVGDRVLRNFGDLLTSKTRKSDVVCRFGGEEFIILLPNADLDHACDRAHELREAFHEMCLKNELLKRELTISLGLACYPKHGDNAAILIRKADEAMYAAKKGGRNRVEIAK